MILEPSIATRGQELLDDLVGGHEQDADAGVDERVSLGAREVALGDAGAAEQEHVVGALDEAAPRELAGLDEHLPWHASRIERVEGLGGRQARAAAQAIDAALAARLGFDLEDFGQDDERLIAACIEEPLGHLLGRARQLELGEERRDAVADLGV